MGRKRKSQGTRPIRVTDDVYRGANVLASIKDTDLVEMLSDMLRPLIKEEVEKLGLKFPIEGGTESVAEPEAEQTPAKKTRRGS